MTIKIHYFVCFVGTLLSLYTSNCFLQRNLFRSLKPTNLIYDKINSKPLILTAYIESNKLDEGRKLSEVKGLSGVHLKSYSGFFTVNKTYNSNMFFWFFPALSGKINVPILLWLQGGPGSSSMFGLFVENGPLKVSENGTLTMREHTWNREFAVLYIDNPVGTGFSFTNNDKGYAKDENDVAEDLYKALKQFFTLYHEYKRNPFFVTGESYAGKYIPAISYKIYSMGEQAKQSGINLQGMAIGNGLCDPRNMLDYGSFLYQMGLIDEKQRDHFFEEQNRIAEYIDKKQFKKASLVFDHLINSDFIEISYLTNVTGLYYYYNILYDYVSDDFNYYQKFLASNKTRESIHVGNLYFGNYSDTVEKHLFHEIMASVKPRIEKLLDANYRMLFYSGQLDIIVAAPLTENFLRKLQWHGTKEYQTAKRSIYKVKPNDRVVAGYVRQAKNLYQIIIRNAGHMVPYDQPRVALDMITRFVKNESF